MNLATTPEARRVPRTSGNRNESRNFYQALTAQGRAALPQLDAAAYLEDRLEEARALAGDLPESPAQLPAWIAAGAAQVAQAYQEYLDGRNRGAPRRFFTSRAHALNFIRGVAPTKLVDGAWLYGLTRQWNDPDYHALIQTYVEELGSGVAAQNHVVLFKRLLATHECDDWADLSDQHFVQGAIQLALAHEAERYLPEVIGYNLGYEQLPLHLLISAYELNELGIDPYYFTLHVTIDNAATGHAQKAVQALERLMARSEDPADFWQRVQDGYKLNSLGACTSSVIAAFDLEQELHAIFRAKAGAGQNMHSNYCRVAGRSINDWLADPEQMPAFLAKLEESGWIKRGEAPEHSRFWGLLQGERPEMFGVFNAYELQVLRDWITEGNEAARNTPRILSYRAQQRALSPLTQYPARRQAEPRGIFRHHIEREENPAGEAGELRRLEEKITAMGSRDEAMKLLSELMDPSAHHTARGLMATRMYARLYALA